MKKQRRIISLGGNGFVYGRFAISFNAGENYESSPIPIDLILEYFKKIKDKGATHISWNGDVYDSKVSSVRANPLTIRLETDEEFDERKAWHERQQEDKEAAREYRLESVAADIKGKIELLF